MKALNDLKVRTKLRILVFVACVALMVVGVMGLMGMRATHGSLGESNQNMEQVARLGEMKSGFLTMRLDLVYMMALNDQAKLQEKWDDFTRKSAEVRDHLKWFETAPTDSDEREAITAFKDGFNRYVEKGTTLGKMLLSAHAAADDAALAAAIGFGTGSVAPLYNKPAEAVALLVAKSIKQGEEMYRVDTSSFKRLFLVMTLIIIVSLATALSLGCHCRLCR